MNRPTQQRTPADEYEASLERIRKSGVIIETVPGQGNRVLVDRRDYDALVARVAELTTALERIATADHPDSKVCETNMTEHDFSEKLMNIAKAALARGRE